MRALAVALWMAMLAASQAPQPPRATFKSAVDLVPVDVSVVDRNGRPVPDLTAQDFTLLVDGKPRQIASAEFISIAATPEAVPARSLEYSSNAGAAGGHGGSAPVLGSPRVFGAFVGFCPPPGRPASRHSGGSRRERRRPDHAASRRIDARERLVVEVARPNGAGPGGDRSRPRSDGDDVRDGRW